MKKTVEEIEKTLYDKMFEAVGWIRHDPTLEGRIIGAQLLKAAMLEAIRDTMALEKKDG